MNSASKSATNKKLKIVDNQATLGSPYQVAIHNSKQN